MKGCQITFKSCHPVVRRLKYARGVQSFHESRGISYTTAKDIIKDKLGVFFDDLSKLGTHSLRSGGASDSGCQIYAESQRLEMRSVKEQVH